MYFFLLSNLVFASDIFCAKSAESTLASLPPAESKEWRKLSTRNQNAPLSDLNYPQRLHDSITHGIAPWWINKNSSVDFREILRRQQSIVASGLDGKSVYYGGTRAEVNEQRNWVATPGMWRHELHPDRSEYSYSFSFRIDEVLGSEAGEKIENFREAYRSNPYYAGPEGKNKIYEETLYLRGASSEFLEMPGIERKVSVWNEYGDNYVNHFYPKNKETNEFLIAIDRLMLSLKDRWNENPDKSNRLFQEVFYDLSSYLYLSIHGHLANSANFSVAMGNFNFMLIQFGYRGIGHSNLDFFGLVNEFQDFQMRLLKDIRLENPQLKMSTIFQDKFKSSALEEEYLIYDIPIQSASSWRGLELTREQQKPWPTYRLGKISDHSHVNFQNRDIICQICGASKIRFRVSSIKPSGVIELLIASKNVNEPYLLSIPVPKTGAWDRPVWIEAVLPEMKWIDKNKDITLSFYVDGKIQQEKDDIFDVWAIQFWR
ncbi:MAG: hypothetical protein VX642_00120 [Bdellovibrionota bacterium]|nr:hypothetical protein [Bdellovibrionota bacterium]